MTNQSKKPEELETLKTDKGEWLFCRVEKKGKGLEELLQPRKHHIPC